MALNFGTGTLADVSALVEYCNAPVGTEYADLRARHGFVAPHAIRYWCLGNEMDGPWQIGAMNAHDYAKKAREAARILKRHDPSINAILCGSSSPAMPTFGQWDRTALLECWEHVDFLSLHNYAGNWENDTPGYLGYATEFEAQINQLRTILSEVKQKLAFRRDVYLCWDEWNVWYKDRNGDGNWQEAPHLCEEIYNLEDALVIAQWINVFLRHCDVLKIACIAQIANAISPILTTPTQLLRQATFYPFALYAHHARGKSLRAHVSCAHLYHQALRRGPVHRCDGKLRLRRRPDLSPLWQRLVGGREESGEGLCGGAFQLGKHLTSDLKNAARAWVAVGAPVTGTTLF